MPLTCGPLGLIAIVGTLVRTALGWHWQPEQLGPQPRVGSVLLQMVAVGATTLLFIKYGCAPPPTP